MVAEACRLLPNLLAQGWTCASHVMRFEIAGLPPTCRSTAHYPRAECILAVVRHARLGEAARTGRVREGA